MIHTRVKDSFSVRAGVKLGSELVSAEKMQLHNSVKVTAAVSSWCEATSGLVTPRDCHASHSADHSTVTNYAGLASSRDTAEEWG